MPPVDTMTERAENCSSCGVRLVMKGATSFPCPRCGKTTFGRCDQCRDQSVEYTCDKCGFVGP
jgi:predicted RNA-binding Zn-ribbon protein involved in translation (DUF1610 family)